MNLQDLASNSVKKILLEQEQKKDDKEEEKPGPFKTTAKLAGIGAGIGSVLHIDGKITHNSFHDGHNIIQHAGMGALAIPGLYWAHKGIKSVYNKLTNKNQQNNNI